MALIVLTRVAVVLLLIAVGVALRRFGVVAESTLGTLSRLVVDVAFPALVLTRLLLTVDRSSMASEWYVPLLAAVMLVAGWGFGRLLTPRPTDAFLVGLPNWMFLPLLIAQGMFGERGERTVLLFNAGAQVALWTVGISTLTGRANPRQLARNPGLWATLIGLFAAMLWPGLGSHLAGGEALSGFSGLGFVVFRGLELLGEMAIPLAMIVAGGVLGGLPAAEVVRPSRRLVRVLVLRLIAAPAVLWLLLAGAAALVAPLPSHVRGVLLLTAGMPVAISSAAHAKRFGGDSGLAARAVVWSTLLALVTAPMLAWLS